MNETSFGIIDTFLIDSNGLFLGDLHFERTLKALHTFCPESANETQLRKIYDQVSNSPVPLKGRFVFPIANWQNYVFESFPLDQLRKPQLISISPLATQTSGRGNLQNLKTTARTYWDQALILKGRADDIIGVNDKGFVTETSRFNLFIKKENHYLTPPLDSGCLAGVYREFLLSKNSHLKIIEQQLKPSDLVDAEIYIANSVRGILPATLIGSPTKI